MTSTNNVPHGFSGLRHELLRGFAGSFGLKVAHTLLNLVLSIVLARSLAPEGYGIYVFAFSVMSLLAIPVQLGLPTLLIREVARYQYAERWDLLRGILMRSNQVVLLLFLGVGLTAALVLWLLADQMSSVQLSTFAWALLLLPLIALNRLREAALQGLRRVVIGQLPEKFLLPVLLMMALGVAVLTVGLTPPLAMGIYCIVSGVVFIIGAAMLLRALPREARITRPRFDTPAWLRSLLPLSLLAGLHTINGQTDIFMLGILATKGEVGLYRVAFSGAALVIFTLTAVNAVLAPHIARLYSAGDDVRLQRLVTQAVRWTTIAALPVAGAFVLFGGFFLDVFFGIAYKPARSALTVLCIAQLVNVLVGPVHVILNMTGHERQTMLGAIYSAFINVALNAILIPLFGIIGAAIATGASIIVVNIILCRSVWLTISIWSLPTAVPGVGRATSKTGHS